MAKPQAIPFASSRQCNLTGEGWRIGTSILLALMYQFWYI
jgi:hypothetical protein